MLILFIYIQAFIISFFIAGVIWLIDFLLSPNKFTDLFKKKKEL